MDDRHAILSSSGAKQLHELHWRKHGAEQLIELEATSIADRSRRGQLAGAGVERRHELGIEVQAVRWMPPPGQVQHDTPRARAQLEDGR